MGTKEQWVALASELGFEFKEGVDGILESVAGRREIEELSASGELPAGALDALESPLVRTLVELLFKGVMAGAHRGYDFIFFPTRRGGSASRTGTPYSNMTMIFPTRYELGMAIYDETFLSRVGKVLFFQQDIQLGHPELDRLIMIKGKDEQAVQAMLGLEPVQEQLLRMFRASPGWEIRDFGIRFRESVEVPAAARALELMNRAVDLAESLPPP